MKYYNIAFRWYDTDTYCSNIAKAECVEDVKAHYAKYDSAPTIKEASEYDVEDAEKRGKPIVTCSHIEAPAEAEAEAEPEQTNANIINAIKKEIEARTKRSAWSKGITAYAVELLEGLEEAINGGYFDVDNLRSPHLLERALLNGADSWSQYSWGGCSLIYNGDIAERLCSPSELKKTRNGERRPNSREQWLDVQARALLQACERVKRAARAALAEQAHR